MSKLTLLILLASSVSLCSAQSVTSTLCHDNEQVVFSCKIKDSQKTASLCQHRNYNSEGHGSQYLRYRFGEPRKIELEFPSTTKDSLNHFYKDRDGALYFVNGSYLYTIHGGVIVESREKKIYKKLECADANDPTMLHDHIPDEISSAEEADWLRYYHYFDKSDTNRDSSNEDQLCTKRMVDAVAKHLGIKEFIHSGTILSEACVPWSEKPDQYMTAFAYDDGSAQEEKLLVVALVDTKANKVVASYKGTIQEDGATRVETDTLSFAGSIGLVAPGMELFGLNIKAGNVFHPCADGGAGPFVTYLVIDDKVIRPVLSEFVTSGWHYTKGGSERCGSSSEDAETETTDYSVVVTQTSTKGYADLLFTAQPGSANIEPFQCKLHYDGKQYLNPYEDKDCKDKYSAWEQTYSEGVPMSH